MSNEITTEVLAKAIDKTNKTVKLINSVVKNWKRNLELY